ncbi:MAG: exopolyphosphatase [Desulfosudaceae bacterium]
MRIVTRPDFDGIVCAVLLYDALDITGKTAWIEPGDIQKGIAPVQKGDILANLPFHENCALWFDHHYSNQVDSPFEGLYRVAPSAAGLVGEYFQDRLSRDFSELIFQADKIDAADLSPQEVLFPEKHPCLILSMTIIGHEKKDEPYWNRLVKLLGTQSIDMVMKDAEVEQRCRQAVRQNQEYETFLKKYTRLVGQVAITDFRPLAKPPTGNRFLIYSLFPESVVNVKIRYASEDEQKVLVSVGHSIFNRNCRVNVGAMLTRFGGGGHKGAGATSRPAGQADDDIAEIIDILVANQADDAP